MAAEAPRPRVLLVGQGPPSAGGIPSFVTRLSDDRWLRERVHVELLNTTPRGTKYPGALNAANAWLALKHAWQVLRGARRADVVHLNLAAAPTLPLLRALVLARAARFARARVILHAHTGQIEECVSLATYRWLLRLVPRVTDAVVVVSETAQAALATAGVEALRMDNGIEARDSPTGPKEDPPVLSFVGTVSERKGLIDLRDALAKVRAEAGPPLAARVLVAGDGAQEGPGAFERIRRAFREAGLTEVRFVGALSEAEVRALLARSSIFCLPSHWEGFPLTVLEAMAARTAVVATRVGAIPRMLDEGRAGVLVEPGDPDGLARAIAGLLASRDERERLAGAARDRAEREYDQARVVREIHDLYRRVAGGAS